MPQRSLTSWSTLLSAIAQPVLAAATPPDPAGFRDELGHTRAADAAFLAWRIGQPPPPQAAAAATAPEVILWRMLASHDAGALPGFLQQLQAAPRTATDAGALIPQVACPAIEVWTEAELCALHALWRLSLHSRDPQLLDRAAAIARWHLENLQPDHGTNRPWAIGVFAWLDADKTTATTAAERSAAAAAAHHTETLLHNCQTTLGRPDILSAHILADAAMGLSTLQSGEEPRRK